MKKHDISEIKKTGIALSLLLKKKYTANVDREANKIGVVMKKNTGIAFRINQAFWPAFRDWRKSIRSTK